MGINKVIWIRSYPVFKRTMSRNDKIFGFQLLKSFLLKFVSTNWRVGDPHNFFFLRNVPNLKLFSVFLDCLYHFYSEACEVVSLISEREVKLFLLAILS